MSLGNTSECSLTVVQGEVLPSAILNRGIGVVLLCMGMLLCRVRSVLQSRSSEFFE